MRCAIYARKSTDENGAESDLKSVNRQVEHARRFAEERGWTVAEGHVYGDDGISGAEFKNRPGLQALIDRGLPSRAFDALIMAEPSRLGRDTIYTALYKSLLLEANIRIFYYLTGNEESVDDKDAQEIVSFVELWSAKNERLKARLRVRDAHLQRARQGYATGAAPYGYRTKPIYNGRTDGHGNPIRDHCEYEILPEEAEVLRRIFRLYAEGWGMIRIAKRLTSEGVPPPSAPPRRKTGHGWWIGAIRKMLSHELYVGRLVWGQTRKEDRAGRAGIVVKQEARVILDVPHLAIVLPELWQAVQERMKAEQTLYWRGVNGEFLSKPVTGRQAKYLLAQFGDCAWCGAGICTVFATGRGPRRYAYYGCVRNHYQGAKACPNNLR